MCQSHREQGTKERFNMGISIERISCIMGLAIECIVNGEDKKNKPATCFQSLREQGTREPFNMGISTDRISCIKGLPIDRMINGESKRRQANHLPSRMVW